MLDENDKLRAGHFDPNPAIGTRPVNALARAVDSQEVRALTVKELVTAEAKRAQTKADTSKFCTTGHYRLDALTGGFQPEFVWVVGAQTSWGKSSWAVAVADDNLRTGKRVLIVSAEDASSIYGRRLLARRANVSAERLGRQCLEPAELKRVAEVAARAEDVPVYVDARNKPVEGLVKRLASITAAEGIDLVVFDYLQAFRTEKPGRDRRNEINEITRRLTDAVKCEGKAGLILSQLTVDQNLKGPPGKYAIRESQDVSNGAEVIALGFTPDEDVLGKNPGRDAKGNQLQAEPIFRAGRRYLCLEKNKTGPAKEKVEMRWNALSASFDAVLEVQA